VSGATLASRVLLWLGVAVALLACGALAVQRDAYDRLHYVGVLSTVGAALLAAAVVVQEWLNGSGLSALLVAVVLGLGSPVMARATGRAIRAVDGPGAEDAGERS